eukprot:TRINITY_DN217_c1_g1_i1.p1 TRINITY_DN217_c1_g1~~TRINITY_DN217_c1_g1_i1.p1  ORF type:complete len:260 (+),score=96.81 TRINITY_DN217_c1_g1_i1:92-871(+)
MSDRTFFVGGNWKCNGTKASNAKLVEELNAAQLQTKLVDVVVAPVTLHVESVFNTLRKDISVSVQNVHTEAKGAFTGELSPEQVKDFGLEWAILGHSERREIFKESDELVGKKVAAALRAGLKVIACVGEKEAERKSNQTEEVVFRQLKAIQSQVQGDQWGSIVVAYEPVWAIGTGLTATPEQAQDVHAAIRQWLSQNVSSQVAQSTRIIYGGSVKGANANELAAKVDIDGFLVGGASLVASEFVTIVKSHSAKSQNKL